MHVVGYFILGVFALTSVAIYYWAQSDDYKRTQIRARVNSQWRLARTQTRLRLQNENLAMTLRQSGIPLSPAMYYYVRIVLTFLASVFAIETFVRGHNPVLFALPLVAWLFFDYSRYGPMSLVFDILKKQHANYIGKDLYLLYVRVKQQLKVHQDRPRTLYDILRYVLPLLPRLRPALNRCLLMWPRDPKMALQYFAEEIGTEQAEELSKLLYEVEVSSPSVALDLIQQRYTSFREYRLSSFRQRTWLHGLVGFGIALVGVAVVAWDLVVIIQMYTQSLMVF